MPKENSSHYRIATYVNGLLYYYGVVEVKELYRMVQQNLIKTLEFKTFIDVINQVMADDESGYFFGCSDQYLFYLDVEDLDLVLREQAWRNQLPYRPVSEKEAAKAEKISLSNSRDNHFKNIHIFLRNKGWDSEAICDSLFDIEAYYRNGEQATDLLQRYFSKINFQSEKELFQLTGFLNKFLNNTPLWILKGWTPSEVQKRFEKSKREPVPEEPFSQGSILENVQDKVGRNEPCPCGSGKKYKKCCGMFRQEESAPAKGSNSPANADIAQPNSAAFHQETSLPTPAVADSKEPTGKEWEALFSAARNFKEAKCWEWMDDNDLFGVKDPESEEVAYCSIMGKLGEHFALGAYLGAEGLYSFLRMQDSANPEEMREHYFGQKCLMASFEDREQLSERDRSIIKEIGLKFRGRKQWPLFRSLKPGYYPWYITAWECRFLTVCLEQALEVARLCFESKTILDRFEKDRELMLLRTLQDKGQETVWVNEYHLPEVFSKEYSVYGISDEVTLRRLLNSLEKGSATWEVDLFYSLMPVQEKKDDRPYFPIIFLVADLSTGLLIGYTMLMDLKAEANEITETLINSIQSSEKIPNRIVAEKEETRFFLDKICSQLDIKLELVDQLQMIPEARAELLKGNF
ncbi:MAG: SEC-C metal-binding domain-containing protein [Bacillota bacterium]